MILLGLDRVQGLPSEIELLHSHLSSGEGRGLTCANVIDVSKVLAGFVLFNQQLVLSHSFTRKGHSDANSQREAFGNSNDNNGYRSSEGSDQLLEGGIGKEVVALVEHDLQHNEEDHEDEDDEAGELSPFANLICKVLQSLLQKCFSLLFSLFNRMDLVPSGRPTYCKYQRFSGASTDEASSKKERIRVVNMLLDAIRRDLFDIVEAILVHSLIAADVHAFDQHAVGGDPHPWLDDDQVSHDDLGDLACLRRAIVSPDDLYLLVPDLLRDLVLLLLLHLQTESHQDANQQACKHDGETLHPCVSFIRVKETNNDLEDTGSEEDL